MIVENQKQLTEFALDVMKRTPDPRLREIMTSLITHLHGFIRDVRLTEREFQDACAIIAEMGHHTTDTHNEVVLMAGSLGVSSLVCLLNNGDKGNTETNQNLLGPFWRLNQPVTPNGASIMRSKTVGEPLFARAKFMDVQGKPIVGAEVAIRRDMRIAPFRVAFGTGRQVDDQGGDILRERVRVCHGVLRC